MDKLNERFLAAMRHSGLSKTEFAGRLGVSQGVMSHISSGRNKPGTEMLVSLLQAYPEIAPEWLILGEGSMFRPKEAPLPKDDLKKKMNELELLVEMNQQALISRLKDLKQLIDKR
jgi:transcriptional regulator with XRE-family HTH domain